MAKRIGMGYDVPEAYDRLIASRLEPVARALVEAAAPRAGEHVLELGAGTGLVTRMASERVGPDGAVVATDLSAAMLAVASRHLDGAPVQFVLADYARPLPFLDASFDLVLAGLTYVQDAAAAVREVVRVLRPGGRLGLAMWGNGYGEVRMLSAARRSLGLPPYPPAAPGRATRRLERAGLDRVRRRDLRLAPRFGSVDEYLAYRRGFGVPLGQTEAQWRRSMQALREHALRAAAADGSLTLDWSVVVLTARRPR